MSDMCITDEMDLPPGLARVIYDALRAHPEWEYDENGRAACSGPGCSWTKRRSGGTKRQWIQHQKYVLTFALAEAGVELTKEGSE